MPVSIVDLGNSLRCPLKNCDNFGKITKLKISQGNLTLDMVCDKDQKSYSRKYSINQFIRMAESALIDKEWIVDFQKKMLIFTGRYIQIKGGMEGSFLVKDQGRIMNLGKNIMCNCGSISAVTFLKVKKTKTQLNLYCSHCFPKGKKIWMESGDVIRLAKAGLIDNSVAQKVKDEYEQDAEEFDVSESYSVSKGIMASWVQEDLGMLDEGGGAKKCYICGTTVSDTMDRCPKCGSDL